MWNQLHTPHKREACICHALQHALVSVSKLLMGLTGSRLLRQVTRRLYPKAWGGDSQAAAWVRPDIASVPAQRAQREDRPAPMIEAILDN
jgi:hypothetical protein